MSTFPEEAENTIRQDISPANPQPKPKPKPEPEPKPKPKQVEPRYFEQAAARRRWWWR